MLCASEAVEDVPDFLRLLVLASWNKTFRSSRTADPWFRPRRVEGLLYGVDMVIFSCCWEPTVQFSCCWFGRVHTARG